MTGDMCSDDRFELIEKAKGILMERTNIEMRPDEMMALDSILFRCWQMGWLDQLRESHHAELIANRDESIHNLVKVLDKRQERIKALESLVRDMRNLMATPAWDRGGWSIDGKCVEFDTRMAELGIEVSE